MKTFFAVVPKTHLANFKDIPVEFFTTRTDALSATMREQHFGKVSVEPVAVWNDYMEYVDEERRKLARSGLAKLTIDEQRALGLLLEQVPEDEPFPDSTKEGAV